MYMGIYKDLKKQNIVITGGAGGSGLDTALRFLLEDSKVVI